MLKKLGMYNPGKRAPTDPTRRDQGTRDSFILERCILDRRIYVRVVYSLTKMITYNDTKCLCIINAMLALWRG